MAGPRHISGKYRPSEIRREIEALAPGEQVTIKRSEFPRISSRGRLINDPSIEESVVQMLWKIPESTKNITFKSDMENGLITFTRLETPAPPGALTFVMPVSWNGEYRIRPDGFYEKDEY